MTFRFRDGWGSRPFAGLWTATSAVPLFVLVATLGVVGFAGLSWTDGYWSLPGPPRAGGGGASGVRLALSYWNPLGFWS